MLLAKMFSRVTVLMLFLAYRGVSRTYSSSEHVPEAPDSVVNELQAHNAGIHAKHLSFHSGMRIHKQRDAGRYLEAIAASSVMLAALFLLIRCASYIYEVSQLSEGSERSLAKGGSCGEEVSPALGVARCFLYKPTPIACRE